MTRARQRQRNTKLSRLTPHMFTRSRSSIKLATLDNKRSADNIIPQDPTQPDTLPNDNKHPISNDNLISNISQ